MANEKELITIIFLMMLVTIIPRVFPLLLKTTIWPQWFKESLEFLPVAIVSTLVIPNIVYNGYNHNFHDINFYTTIIAIIVAYISKNLIITVISSLFAYYLFSLNLFT